MHAWVLNFDADRELRHPDANTLPASAQARFAELRRRVEPLWLDGDVVLFGPDERADGFAGRAWCPTPCALRRLAQAGARLPVAPAYDVLCAVNHRAFCAALGQRLPGAQFVRDLDTLRRVLDDDPLGAGWLMKRPHGFAGSGQRRVKQLDAGELSWARASFQRDGLQVEPLVDIIVEVVTHGWVGRDGEVVLGDPCLQVVGAGGVWQRTIVAGDAIGSEERDALTSEASRVAEALHAAGYHGPFGVDAYRYRTPQGEAFNPCSEINARYTMGWALGMGERRPDLVSSSDD